MCFDPRPHHDPRFPPSPFFHFENIRVHHNCCPAFGLLIGWRKSRNSIVHSIVHSNAGNRPYRSPITGRDFSGSENSLGAQFLCYSGDTRPSHGLVRACRHALERWDHHGNKKHDNIYNDNSSDADLFLIHEATFRDDDATMALKKKHSTIGEAIRVATDIPRCSRVLISHFSQRYDNVSSPSLSTATPTLTKSATPQRNDGANESANGNHGNSKKAPNGSHAGLPTVGLAVDGLWVHLD